MTQCKVCGTNTAKILTKIKLLRNRKSFPKVWVPKGLSPSETTAWRQHAELYRVVKITNPEDLAAWGPSYNFIFTWAEAYGTYVAYNTPYWISFTSCATCRANKKFKEVRP